MRRDEFEDLLKRFVEKLASLERGSVTRSTLLFEGLIDSMRILDLISFVERLLDTRIPDEAITLQNFRTVRAIADAFVEAPENASA